MGTVVRIHEVLPRMRIAAFESPLLTEHQRISTSYCIDAHKDLGYRRGEQAQAQVGSGGLRWAQVVAQGLECWRH